MKTRSILFVLILSLCSLAASASGKHAGGHGHDEVSAGQAGRATEVTRTVQVEMHDTMRFTPASFSVKQGETLRFVVKNAGKVRHEFVLGTKKGLQAHDEAMKNLPEMEHAEDNMLSLAPGQTGELIWKFTISGPVYLACLRPGHYAAGMKGEIQVGAR